jgi:membrane protease subunit HflC
VSMAAGPGIYFKIPFLQEVASYDGREILYVAQAKDVVTRDKQKLLVDNYALWRIDNPQRFFATVHDQQGALQRLDDFVYAVLRDELSRRDLPQIVRTTRGKTLKTAENTDLPAIDEGGRGDILKEITRLCNAQAHQIGVRIVDVRIRRADLPEENEQAVFSRMVEERNRISKKFRAQGNSTLEQTKAETDRNVKRTLSIAERDAQITRGKADAQAAHIYAEAYSANKELYIFLKSLETLEKGIGHETSLMVDMEKGVFKLLKTKD